MLAVLGEQVRAPPRVLLRRGRGRARGAEDRGGERSLALAGEMESMSRTPLLLRTPRGGRKTGDVLAEDILLMRSPARYVGEEAIVRGADRARTNGRSPATSATSPPGTVASSTTSWWRSPAAPTSP
jgi:hypothetical protein